MTKVLQLTGLPSFSSPNTYGVGLRLGHTIKVRDEDAVPLLATTTPNPEGGAPINVMTLTGLTIANYDVTGRYNDGGDAFYDPFAKALVVSGGKVADTLDSGLGPLARALLAGSAERYGVDYNATAADNAVAFNLCLAENRVVSLSKPGQYMIGGAGQDGLRVPRNTTLVCGDNVELILASGTYMPLIRNANAFTAANFTNVQVVWELGTPSFRCYIQSTGIELAYPVGSRFGLLGLLGSNASNRGFQGIWKVQSVAANRIYFHLPHQPPSGGNSAATATIYPVDSGIRIIGGMWDGNKSGNGGVLSAGEPRSSIHSFRNAQDLIVRGVKYRRGHSWCLGTNNVRDVTISDIDTSTYIDIADGGAHDIVHLAGGHRNVVVERISADCPDNIVGLTHDVLGAPGNANYPNYDPGDSYETVIRDIHGRETVTSIVALWGNIDYLHHSVNVGHVTGKSPGSAVQLMTYGPTNMKGNSGGTLTVRDCAGAFGGGILNMQSDGNWDTVVVDGGRNEVTTTAAAMVTLRQGASPDRVQTIKKLEIRNLRASVQGSTSGRSGPVVEITNSNVDDLSIEGLNGMRLAANVSLIAFLGTLGTVKRAVVAKCASESTAAGDSFIVSCENTSATALGLLTVRDCDMVGTTTTGGIVRQATTGRVTKIRSDNNTVTATENVSGIVRDNLTGGQTAVLETVTVATT